MDKPVHWTKYPWDARRWPNFSPRELACKGTGLLLLDPATMDKLQALRDRLGRPLLITSAYRSPSHNRAVGGAKNSMHMRGIAFDVRMENHDPQAFIAAARAVGFTGIGTYPRSGFTHIDTGPVRSWGSPWPTTDTGLPAEARRAPETVTGDAEGKAAVGAGISGAVAAALDAAPAAGGLLGQLAPAAQLVATLAAVGFIAYLLWKRSR